MEGLIGLAVLVVLAVPVLLVVALALISGLRGRVARLEGDVDALRRWQADAVAREPTLAERVHAAPSMPSNATPSAMAPGATAPPIPRPMQYADDGVAAFDTRVVSPNPSATPLPISAEVASSTATPASTPDLRSTPRATFDIDDPAAPFATATPPPLPPRPPARPPQPPAFVRAIKGWFTEGNVPVKVGVLVLFAGLAALMKYAADAGWLRVPIELRLAGIALAAIGGLVFGWRQREVRRPFALSLQGGAIGVLLLVVFAAFKLYGLMPASVAFGISIALVAGTGVLAVRQDALALAVFGLLAGFLAPLWLSTGSGNHVALFGYYAVLNAGIFAIAWWRAWRVLNLLGFVFTFGIGTLWGVLSYTPEHYATTQPFLALFFAFYLLIPLLHARRRAPSTRDAIDATLVFGTPLVAFSLQAALLDGDRMPLAFCALGLGALYAGLAAFVRGRASLQALTAPYAMLAVAFATLAVPLALSAQATACVFAVEGALLCWYGLRQDRALPQIAGVLLQLGAAVAFAMALFLPQAGDIAVFNARFAGALLIALAGFASALWYRRDERRGLALAFYLWALAWWLLALLDDVSRYVQVEFRTAVSLGVLVATGWLAAEVHARVQASRALAWTGVAVLVLGIPMAFAMTADSGYPLANGGWLAWLAFAALGARLLRVLRSADDTPLTIAHVAWWLSLLLVASITLRWATLQGGMGSGWQWAALALPWLAVLVALERWPQAIATPIGDRFEASRNALHGLVGGVVAIGATLALFDRGDSHPLPWIALVNPLDLAQLVALTLLARFALHGDAATRARRLPWLAGVAFVFITTVTLRATHHWGGVPWSIDMADTSLVQTSLSIVWSVLGVIGWIVGSRRGQRGVWIAGAVLMGVVLVKLVLVDREHLGNLLGIASFLAYGLLCVAVGYIAPAPPRRVDATTEPA